MIVLIGLKNAETRKAMVRNKVFHEVSNQNKRLDKIPAASISMVYWPDKVGMQKVPVKDWIELAEENNYFNITE